ncbi:hypothetical protein [Autumnicola edwardsiae]|jgi:macrodomain Ter protein organizer (MatP/YcbG family)|uniref:Uncharacterized protein n=1 Tax=Autumnicola edwardsiae TaxID=3075594 RepID=A0ABU3CTA1_9FLAO|nr:hypothetical protein [Zunongwangia sp. F297]MDT0649135.1 hypothetical protein [Zunongwangia sp. F297]
MEKVRKLIDIEEDVLNILEQEAKKQKRSLKNLLEYTIEETARKLESPSAEYQTMMDDMLQRLEKDEVNFSPIEEIKKKYDL